jgi:hypothetical protein
VLEVRLECEKMLSAFLVIGQLDGCKGLKAVDGIGLHNAVLMATLAMVWIRVAKSSASRVLHRHRRL